MRTTEVLFGLFAGIAGAVLAVLAMNGVLPFNQQTTSEVTAETIRIYSFVCLAANLVGIMGALIVLKNHVVGSIIMTVMMVVMMVFGFPWQSIPAVAFIISIVLAMVPVKTHDADAEQKVSESAK